MPVLKNSLNATAISCLLWATVALCLSFSPLLFNFVWGNHDWMPLLADSSLRAGLVEGRFAQYILLNVFLAGKILPVLNITLGFACYSAALVLLWSRFFKFATAQIPAVLFTTAAATLPYVNEILYFHFITFSQLTWPIVIVVSLLAAQKASRNNYILNTIISAFLLFLAIGGYPASAGLYAVTACLWALSLSVSQTTAKQFVANVLPFAISLFFAFIVVNIVHIFLKKNGLMIELYNNKPTTLAEMAVRIPDVFLTALQSFIQPQPFFSLLFKITTTLVVLLFAATQLFTSRSFPQFIFKLLLMCALLLAVKLPALISQNGDDNYFARYDPTGFMVRTDFYTLPSLILYCLFYLRQKIKQCLRNILYVLSLLLVVLNINANLNFCKTQTLGFGAENKLLQRIIARIHNQPAYKTNRLYTIIQAGELPLRTRYYTPQRFDKYGYYTLQTPFSRYWIPNEYYNFTTPVPFIREGNSVNPHLLSQRAVSFLSAQIELWPSPDSLYIENDYIILALTPEGKDTLVQQFKALKR